ncbi:ribosomal RNA processing protein 1 homolog B [Kryptolebias marmoratus]|uniref:ribosomal RNA processing protein 1 homolog B n=1 Tax=Kryptolebias marmoratus TaxID=37003 RepID=UPI0007F8A782|nr:ribosomal RNA processing protein 1 homolog B [Kryptolebias marmoratus]
MASVQEPEVFLAQRLASNEKTIRTRTIRKLRKYISVRSLKASGGFTEDELLKLWKGLFYCLWMQDKPLLQEELSNHIASLIHGFHDIDKQLMYLESFLQTLKREWNGIDRLRMDKFYQLVRFMFRQTFEVLKRKNWETSAVVKFLQLLTSDLLQNDTKAPSGLQFHILNLYLTELAAVGSAELTADQNLVFIEPFCTTAAKTKNRTLFSAICSNIFSTIIDQAPFAVEDLMKEMKASDSDSGQESEEEDEDGLHEEDKTRSKTACKKSAGRQINGRKPSEEDDDEDDPFHSEDSDSEMPRDDMGPVLQFDYSAVADKLFELASRNSTSGYNRQKLYKIIKVLRDLSEGIFPGYEEEEEVSTDEDDDMFCSRKRMKRPARMDNDEEEAPTKKKRKDEPGKKKEELNKQNQNTDSVDGPVHNEKKKKKRKKKKKKKNAENKEQSSVQVESNNKETCSEDLPETVQLQNSSSETPEVPAGALLLEATKQPEVTEEGRPESQPSESKNQSKKKKKKGNLRDSTPGVTDVEEQTFTSTEASSEAEALVQVKKKKGLKAGDCMQIRCETTASPKVGDKTPAKNKKKSQKAKVDPASVNGVSLSAEVTSEDRLDSGFELTPQGATSTKKKHKKKSQKTEKVAADVGSTVDEITCGASEHNSTVQPKKMRKKKSKQEVKLTPEEESGQTHEESAAADDHAPTPSKKKKNKKGSTSAEEEETQSPLMDAQTGLQTSTKKKKKKILKQTAGQNQDGSQLQVDLGEDTDNDTIMSTGKPAKKKKRKIPVEFEYEADEVEGMTTPISLVTGAKTKRGSDVSERSTPLSLKKSQKGKSIKSDFITFQSKTRVPQPLFCKTSRSPNTPLSSKKKRFTPMSESKKVTFGLKNNKTAEFKKTDRSLLLSPDGTSRVPFDPQQKPKFGVLKSPITPSSTKKTCSSTPRNKAKRRPMAADFF